MVETSGGNAATINPAVSGDNHLGVARAFRDDASETCKPRSPDTPIRSAGQTITASARTAAHASKTFPLSPPILNLHRQSDLIAPIGGHDEQ